MENCQVVKKKVSVSRTAVSAVAVPHTARVTIPIAAVIIPAPSPFSRRRHSRRRHSRAVTIPAPSPFPRRHNSCTVTAVPTALPSAAASSPAASSWPWSCRRATDSRRRGRRCAVVAQPTRAVVARLCGRRATDSRAVVGPSSCCRHTTVVRHGCLALALTQAVVVVMVVCSGVACPRAAVAAVAVRGTLDLEKTKKSRAEAESAAWEMCATGKTQDTLTICPNLPQQPRLQRQLLSHHDAVAFPLAPHPAATDNTSFGPVFKIPFFFLVFASFITGVTEPSSPPLPRSTQIRRRGLQPVTATSSLSPPPPTHRRGLQPIAATSDSSPHPSPLSPPLTARKGLHYDTVCCRYDGDDDDGNAEGGGGGDVEGDGDGDAAAGTTRSRERRQRGRRRR
ncbi:hypothetical protein EDB85DRAFT_2283080 [Lactarius pseudohatsudake]|nr:hypothetical protein EDB85DRAFT_2283080 [Lactarius pseudohatsudake]